MQRIVCTAFGSPDLLSVIEEPTPSPGPGQVLVAVEAAGASFADSLIVQGRYQLRPPLPFTPGSVLAGRVLAVGDEVSAPAAGTSVAGLLMGFGAYTSHVVLAADRVSVLPEGVTPTMAVSATESYSTLVFAVTHRVAIARGEWVVVLGAGGGIGLAAVDVVTSLGARVVAVASTEAKRAAAVAAGAVAAIGYPDLKDAIRAITGPGADVVFDPVGGPASESSLRALREGGRLCVLGFASGEIPRLPANIVLLRNRSIIGVDWGDWARFDERAAVELMADVLARLGRGEIHPAEPTVYPLAEAGDALNLFANRSVIGKVVLVPN